MVREAIISKDGTYRYGLLRVWDESLQRVLFIMLNPSTADAYIDDPTIRRCIGFAKSWGFGSIAVANLYPLRSTDPEKLLWHSNPLGVSNNEYIIEMASRCSLIVTAWGNGKIVERLEKAYPAYKPLKGLKTHELHYLELSKTGDPKHPLYLKGDLRPTAFSTPKYNSLVGF